MPHDVMQQIQQEKLNVQESGNEVLADSLGRIQQYAKNSVEDLNALNVIVKELTSGGNNLSNSIDKVVYYFEKYKSVSKQATDSTNIFRSSYDGLGSRSSSQLKKLTSSLQEVKEIQTELGSNFKFSATDNVVLLTRQISKLKNTLKGLGNIELNVSPKNLPKFQTGGKVTGGPSSGDKILARLNAGQYVFNKRQMSNLGRLLGQGKQLSHQQVFKLAGGKPVVQKQGQTPKFATGGQIEQRKRKYMSDSQLQTQSNDVNQKIHQRRVTARYYAFGEKDDSVKKVYQEQDKLLRELQRSYRSLSKDKQRLIQIDEKKLDSIKGIEEQIQKIRQLNQFYEDLNEEVNKFSSQSARNLQQLANMANLSAKSKPKGSKERNEDEKRAKQYVIAANISQDLYKKGNKTAQRKFEVLSQKLSNATDVKNIQRIVSDMKKLNTQIQKGQVKVSGFQNVMGGVKKEAESMAKQFNEFFGGTPIGMAAIAAGIMLIGKQIKKVTDELANSIVQMSKMNVQMSMLKNTSANSFGSKDAIEGFRNEFSLTREQIGKLAPQMSRFVTEGNKSFSTLQTLADNLKDSLGQLDIATFEKMMNLLKELPQKQIQVLMGVNTDSIDKMNTYANLLKNGRLSETLEIYQKGGFGEVEGMEGASKGQKEAVKTQREIKKEIEDIKYFLFGMLPDFVKSGTVMVSLIGGLVVSVGAIIASAMKNTMALGMIAKNSFRTYGKGDVVPVFNSESNFGGQGKGQGKGKGWTPTRLGAKIGGKTGAKIGRSIGKMAGPASAALVGLGVGLTVADMLGSHFQERRMKEVNYRREKRIEQEEKNKNSLQNKLKTGDKLTLQDFNLGKTSDSLKEQQLLKRKADYGNTGGKWGGAIGGASSGLAVGAAIGSVVPLVGTIIGGAIGGLVGGIGGYFAGEYIGKEIAESEEEKKFKSQDNAISVAKKQLKDSLGVNAQSRTKKRNRVVNDLKYLRGIEAVLKQIKNDSLTAIYTQNMQAIKGQMQVMNLLGGSRTIFESLRKSMLRNASDKMNTKLLALNQQYDKVSKSDMSYEAKMNAANVLQIQRAKSISEFVQTVQESIGKYEEIPQVILNGIKEKINSLNFENLSKGFIGTSTQTFDMLKENLENSLLSVNYAFNSFVEDQEKILNARDTLNKQKEEVVKSLGDEYVKNGQIDQEKIAKQLQENESLISTKIQTTKEKSVTQKDIEKKDLEKTYLEIFENLQKNLSLKDKTEGTVAEKWDQIGKLKDYANNTIKQLTELKDSKSLSEKEKEHINKQIESITELRKQMNNMNSDNYSFARQQDFENSIKGFAIASTRFNYSAMTDVDREQINDLQNKNLLFKRAQGVYGTEQFSKSNELKSIENFQNETTKLKENLNKFVEGLKNNPVVLYYQAQERVFKQNQKYMDSAFGSALGSVMVLESKRKQWIGILENIPETTKQLNEQFQSILKEELPKNNDLDEEQKQYIEKQRKLVELRMKALSGDTNAEGQSIKLNEEIKAMEFSDNIKQLQKNPDFNAYLSKISSFSQAFEKLNLDVAKVRSQLVTSIRESSKLYDEIKNSSVVYSSTKKIQAGESQVALSSYDLDVDKVTSTLRDLFKQTVDRYEEQKKQIYETTKARKKDAEKKIEKLKAQYEETGDKDKLKEIQVAERQYSNIDVQEQKRLADLELKKKQDVVKYAQQQRDLKLKILDYENQSIDIQRDLASSIGAPLQTVLRLEQASVDIAKKKYETEVQTLDYMLQNGMKGQALEEQKLRVQKQQAEVIKNAMGAQRSALQKLMGNVFGQFTKFSWMGTSNKAKIFGQGYMETSDGMTVSTGGVYTGGYQSRVASANANGGVDPLTGQSYNAGGAAKRIPLGKTDSTAKDKSSKDTSAKDGSKKDEKGVKGTETTPDDPIAKIVHQREQKKKQMAKKQELEIPALQATIKTSNIVEKIYNLLVDAFGKKKDTSAKNIPTTPTTPTSSGSGTSTTPTSVKDTTSGNEDTPAKDTNHTTPTISGNEVASDTSSKKEQKKYTSVKDESTTKETEIIEKGEFKGSLRTFNRDLQKREQQLKNSREQQIQNAQILDEYSVQKANISNAQDELSNNHEILSFELENLQKKKKSLQETSERKIKGTDEEIAKLEGKKAINRKKFFNTKNGIDLIKSEKEKLEGQFNEEKDKYIAPLQERKKAAQKILSERKQWIKKGDFELAYNGVTLADDQANETRYHDNTGRYDYKLLKEIISDMNTKIEFAKKLKVDSGVSINDTTDAINEKYRSLVIENDKDYKQLLGLQEEAVKIETELKRLRTEKEKIENDKSQQVSNVETEIDSKRIQIEDVKAQQETLSQEQRETDTVYLKKLQENGMTGVNSLQEAQVAFNNKKSENNDEEEKIKRDREAMLQYIADKTNTVYQETKHNIDRTDKTKFETVQFNQAMRDLHEGKVKKGDENYLQTLIMATKGKDEILKFVHSNQDTKKLDYQKVFQMQKEVAKVKEQRRQTIDSIYEHLPESIYKGQRMNLLRSADLQRKFGVKNYEQLKEKTKGMSNQQLSSMLEQERNARNARIREKLNSYGGGDNWAGVKGIGTGHMEQAKSIMSSVKGVSMGFNPFGGGRKETQLDRSRSGNTSDEQKQDKMKISIQFDTQGDNIVAKVKQIAMQNAQQITNEGMRRS